MSRQSMSKYLPCRIIFLNTARCFLDILADEVFTLLINRTCWFFNFVEVYRLQLMFAQIHKIHPFWITVRRTISKSICNVMLLYNKLTANWLMFLSFYYWVTCDLWLKPIDLPQSLQSKTAQRLLNTSQNSNSRVSYKLENLEFRGTYRTNFIEGQSMETGSQISTLCLLR